MTKANSSSLIEMYNQYIDHAHGNEVSVYGVTWDPSYVLQQMDPIAYRVGFFDWLDLFGIDSDEDIVWDQSI